ncbi:uncharacterized protein LOC133306789 [Gastrolobium bilobum]|uniref:uncharacterized protein LOC133306789 n=1 Tax=Gastrolobium bilobum TaxID=150636 RepID=UPI002AAFB59D|nr:uncharacterized protein LOC133306789 [Gastrolobium bilobum]
MAFFRSTTDPGSNVTVTKEEFNLFHNIDRLLFTRLVVKLGRDPGQSIHVMSFILFLEKMSKDFRLVKNLLSWPDKMLHNLADESLLALNCIESVHFPYNANIHDKGLPLIQNLTRMTISLKYLTEKRMHIIPAVTKLLNEVCSRAFTDIVQKVQYEKAMKEQNFNVPNLYGTIPNPYMQQQVLYFAPAPPRVAIVQPQQIAVPVTQWNEGSSSHYGVSNRKEFNRGFNQITTMFATNLSLGSERKEVTVDDRTIFMTFSKGYPISESEIRDFFSRRYGYIVEDLYMQEVQPPEQPLYARLVVRPEAINVIDHFFEATSRVKFAINGKHIWARRYFRKGGKSPPATSPVTSRTPSPSEPGTSYG